MNSKDDLIVADERNGPFACMRRSMQNAAVKARNSMYTLDARLRTLSMEPEEGAATAEYAVVLIAATGFAAVLTAILKSDAIKKLLTEIVKKALNVG